MPLYEELLCGDDETFGTLDKNQPAKDDAARFIQSFDGLGELDSSLHLPATSSLCHSVIAGYEAASQDLFAMPDSEQSSSFSNDLDLRTQLLPELDDSRTEDWLSLSPLDRWRNSPPEMEAAHLTDIMKSVAQAKSPASSKSRANAQKSGITQSWNRRSHQSTPSIAASDSTRSSATSSSASSARSLGSNHSGSFGRFYVGEPVRRRRRRHRKSSPVPHSRSEQRSQPRPYQCTFCTDSFKTKYDWTRHEKTLHLSLESWVCAPFGPTYNDEPTNISRCAFCDVENPSEAHIQEHRFSECQEKPSALRTFYRKDHLSQHLRLVHGIATASDRIETWKSEVMHINSRCGFCGETFTRWSGRNDHLAAHFRKGATMNDWTGCRGFVPAVALAVDNAMPPYLIGIEATGIDPFSASRRGGNVLTGAACSGNGPSSGPQRNTQPTPFEKLTEHLIRFVRDRQADGMLITDESIQEEARRLVYGDADPWNQTAADNPEWLRFFKDGMGLNSSAAMIDAHTCPNPVFPLPWTIDASGQSGFQGTDATCNPDLRDSVDPWVPWSWQSPECLAEFRRFNQASGSRGVAKGQDGEVCSLDIHQH